MVFGLKFGDIVYQYSGCGRDGRQQILCKRYYSGWKGGLRKGEGTFQVDGDRDFVVAYGIKGDMVAYTVNYQDAAGNALLESDTYYGNPGERQYVSSRYVDGYVPQALNQRS